MDRLQRTTASADVGGAFSSPEEVQLSHNPFDFGDDSPSPPDRPLKEGRQRSDSHGQHKDRQGTSQTYNLVAECPCGAKLLVKSRHVNKVVSCPKCKASVTAARPPVASENRTARSPQSRAARAANAVPTERDKQGRPGTRFRQPDSEPDELDEPEESPATELRPTLYALGAWLILLVVGAVLVDQFGGHFEQKTFLPLIGMMTLYGLLGALIGAVTLRAAAKWAAGLDFPYGAAYLTMLLAYLLTMSVAVPTSLLISTEVTRHAGELTMRYLFLPVQLPLFVVLISTRHRLSFARGTKVTGVMLLIACAMGIVLGGFALIVHRITS